MLVPGFGSFPPKDCIPDTVNGAKFIRDLYEMSNDESGAPVRWPQPQNTCVHSLMKPCANTTEAASCLSSRSNSCHESMADSGSTACVVVLWVMSC